MADLTECAGRVMAVGIAGPALDDATRRTLERLQPGAVVLFKRNIVDPNQLRQLTDDLHRLPSRPLLAVDHEGGRVNRLPAAFTEFPPAEDIGRAGADAAAAVGRAMGRELASVGVDVNFAPVLDVPSEPGNFLGDRSFGSDAAQVAAAAVAFVRGLLDGGVLPCGKHFPGHGGTTADSHVARPVVARSLAELDTVDLVPFRAAIQAGVPMLMTAHVLYPALDREAIATLSPRIAGDLLRRRLGFDGVLWSDHLAMRAVRADLMPGAAAVAALNAGVDGVLVCGDLDEADATADGLYRAIDSGDLPIERLRAAAARIAALAGRHADRPALPLPVDAHQQLADRVRAVAAASRAC